MISIIQEKQLEQCEIKFNELFVGLEDLEQHLIYVEGRPHRLQILRNALIDARNKFFDDKSSIDFQKFYVFKDECDKALKVAENHFEEHPGIWNDYIFPALKAFTGALLLLIATLLVLPLYLYLTYEPARYIFNNTFFSTPSRDTDFDNAWKSNNFRNRLFSNNESQEGVVVQIERTLGLP